jgi:PEP-CTERM motif-containing protein
MSKMLQTCAVVALSTVFTASICPAAMIVINSFNNSTPATVFANNGVTSDSFNTILTQFNATYTPDSGPPATFETFCVDLFHTVTDGQDYAVNLRSDLATAFTNGSQMAEIYDNFGASNLTANPDQAAAVQIALWDLSLNNHTPTTFESDGSGNYSSGDPGIFSINLSGDADAATIANQVNSYLQGAIGATTQGMWLDAAAAGDALNRGQSVLVPPTLGTPIPEPTTVILLLGGAAGLILRRRPSSLKIRFR